MENTDNQKAVKAFVFNTDTIIRAINIDDETWFVAKDICNALDIVNNSAAITTLKENYEKIGVDIKGVVNSYPLPTSGGIQNMTIISETGMYDLISQSRKPTALKFKYWVHSEVLPSIRKTGMYFNHNQQAEFSWDMDAKKSNNVYLAMSKIIEIADKTLSGKVALRALNFFAGMPVDDLVAEIDERNIILSHGTLEWANSAVASFINEMCEVGADYKIQATVLYKAFCEWNKQQGVKNIISQKRFGVYVSDAGFIRQKYQIIYYTGIKLKESLFE